MKHFIAVYTNKVKSYCEKEFYENLFKVSGENPVFICDNTEGYDYTKHLTELCNGRATVLHSTPETGEKNSKAHRNIVSSLLTLREEFLKSDCDTFTIIESDVIPYTPEPLKELENALNNPEIGAVGGVFYQGWHAPYMFNPDYKELVFTHHVLSGFTMYRRALIEKYPFRIDLNNLGAFPDAFICVDAGKDWKFADLCSVKCHHREISWGNRGAGLL